MCGYKKLTDLTVSMYALDALSGDQTSFMCRVALENYVEMCDGGGREGFYS